jgi:hypothetical protein
MRCEHPSGAREWNCIEEGCSPHSRNATARCGESDGRHNYRENTPRCGYLLERVMAGAARPTCGRGCRVGQAVPAIVNSTSCGSVSIERSNSEKGIKKGCRLQAVGKNKQVEIQKSKSKVKSTTWSLLFQFFRLSLILFFPSACSLSFPLFAPFCIILSSPHY